MIRDRRDAHTLNAHRSEAPTVLRMKLVGANPEAAVEGLKKLEGKINYLVGSDL
jgi:hypothetical protein